MSASALDVLMLNSINGAGGAALVASSLGKGLRQRGHSARLMAGTVVKREPLVLRMPRAARGQDLKRRALQALGMRAQAQRIERRDEWPELEAAGRDYLGFRGSWRVAESRPDILHAHNLHGGYFDLRALPALAATQPLVVTMHDAWLLSGHCAHSFACERWRTGCGACPDLTIPVAIDRDRTAENWRDKSNIFAQSKLWVTAPSQWLLDKAAASMLAPAAVAMRVIPNGADRDIFSPGDKAAARARLGLPAQAPVLLFAANGVRHSPWKDFETLRAALAMIDHAGVILLGLGEAGATERLGRHEIRFVPPQPMGPRIADYYRAADVYVHAAKADTFPNVVLEALACGAPVVAMAIGGIPEQIKPLGAFDEGEATGMLVPPADAGALAQGLSHLLNRPALARRLGANAARDVDARFGLDLAVDRWIAFYQEMMAAWPAVKGARS